ncbi:hypothetical protein K474DRAFT_1705165 [Panus rudis PR-1116 ss-1]|nr:hypothetical protein K474DRAFT_1705165 [Panus rudis PR-1116 ss-1]
MSSSRLLAAARDTWNNRHVRLSGVPRTATPADIRRLCAKQKVENIDQYAIEYHNFRPTRNAIVSFTTADLRRSATPRLQNSVLGGYRLTVNNAREPNWQNASRGRGARGKHEASLRGIIRGDGPGAGIQGSGKNVILSGVPGKTDPEAVRGFLRSFELYNLDSEQDVVKLEWEPFTQSWFSTYLIRLDSVSDAHHLVRRANMSYWYPSRHGGRFQLRAHVVY